MITQPTPTPWQVNTDATGDLFISGGAGIYIAEMVGFHDDERTEEQVAADAQHIVECVNAFNGVPRDAVNGIGAAMRHNYRSHQVLQEKLAAVTQQHADLLAASAAMLNRYVDLINCGDCGHWNPETEKEVIAMRQVLAKAGMT